MSGNSAKVRDRKKHKIGERSRDLCSQECLIVTPWQYVGKKTDELSKCLRCAWTSAQNII